MVRGAATRSPIPRSRRSAPRSKRSSASRSRRPGCNYYRDGNDSVAWHADRELRDLADTRIAIVTLGARRPFLVRPKGGGTSRDVKPGSGDLLVMGGACQMRWEHSRAEGEARRPAHLLLLALDQHHPNRTGVSTHR